MAIEQTLYTTLGPLVSNRVTPDTFPATNGTPPPWPAIRYSFISHTPHVDQCGDGGDDTADQRIQLDVVHTTFKALRTLRLQVMAAMETFVPPAVIDNSLHGYDETTKTYRATLDYLIYPSSP
jgi:hypothetical protein